MPIARASADSAANAATVAASGPCKPPNTRAARPIMAGAISIEYSR